MKVKCPYCVFEDDYPFLGEAWKGLRTICKKCNSWFNYHTEKGYEKEKVKK